MSATTKCPDGWDVVTFGNVVTCVNRTTKDPIAYGLNRIVGLDHMDSESLPLRRWDLLEALPDGTSFTRTFQSGQVLFGKRRAYQRKVSVPEFDGVCSGDILVFEASGPRMLQEFLPYLVQSDGFFEHALGTSAGSLSPRTKWQELAKYEFALPPVDDQKRIVEVLEAATASQEAAREAAAECQRQLCNLSIQLTKGLTHEKFPLLKFADVLDSKRVPINDAERSKRKGPIPYYGANGPVGTIDEALFDEPLVLFAEDGGRFEEWRSRPVAYRIEGQSWVNNHAHVLRASGLPTGWLYFTLRNFDFTRFVVGTTRTKLNRSVLERLTISVPHDLERRLLALEAAESCDRAASRYAEAGLEMMKTLASQLLGGDQS